MNLKPTILILSVVLFSSCSFKTKNNAEIAAVLDIAEAQYDLMNTAISPAFSDKKFMPRTIEDGKRRLVHVKDWTSGFYPGSLWYLYELTKDEKWKERAVRYTEKLDTIQYWEGNHDVGFIMECSYGNALKGHKTKAYEDIIVQTAKSLSARFRPAAGVLQSWDGNEKWACPVIIDNMMNLELLFNATKISGDSLYYDIAVSHADKTIENHYRDDYSSYHVVEYDTISGAVVQKNTHQGYSDGSAWARGQAWGLYGFTMSYRETKDPKYLEQAKHIANFIKQNPNLPTDQVPFWDYDAPKGPDTPRDASAAAITASALYELSGFVNEDEKKAYLNWAEKIMKSLMSPDYLAAIGTNENFLLKHSVGSKPHEVEIDVPLNYADYYFLEALFRKLNLKD
ncbi:glucuronyl hydrolase [Arenibacter sp. 6A1]|uniref:glycoside hydrolase family 88 protein n=1 Tax=Arenibacter sp. 6A1 TaxID=2720391 RepID=UPI001446A453|nr:glycoside hydrolase family 88 protein [Arenibacter sp. 6A1]NKI26423.1 glucuronyl hydrolase [Arenibacter sp. 6A1]